jgi:deazaflavin-dependent oxidoreductase (nitroreductase family)
MIGPGQELAAQQGPGGEFPPITRSPRRRVMAAGPSRAGSSAGSTSRTPPSWRVLAARRPCCPGRPAAKLGVLAVNAAQARGRQAAGDFPASARRYTRAAVNKVTLRLAGHLAFADLEHVGRKSGTVRHTPVRAFRSGNTVIAGLNFARQSDWYQNIQAAGTCRMRLGGEQLTLGAPALVPAARGVTDLPWLFRFALRHLVHTADYVQLPILQAPPRAQARLPGSTAAEARDRQPADARQEAAGRLCAVRADLPGLRQRHHRCVRPRIPGFSPGGLGPHLTSSGSPRGLSSGFPFARRVLPRRPPSSGFPSSGVLRFVPFGRRPGSGSPFGVPPGSPSLGQSSR